MKQSVDSTKAMKRYFLEYQIAAILNEERLFAWEKSIRIGATYAMSFRAVRRRVQGMGDYLHTSVSLPAALEFADQCKQWVELYGLAAVSMGEIDWPDSAESKAYMIKFEKGRIIAFSSNPKAVRSFGGEVGIDEFGFHKDPKEMLKAAGGRAMWGYPVSVWSSHNGAESEWNRFLTEERARGEKSRWRLMRTTLPEAIEAGLVDKINETRGTKFTPEQFVADTKVMVGGEDAYNEECLCQPRRAGDAAIKWHLLEDARKDYSITRIDMTEKTTDVSSLVSVLAEGTTAPRRLSLGYDVARKGDLSSVWINRHEASGQRRLVALVTMRDTKFGTQRELIATLFRVFPTMCGCGDSTGIGMQVCEELSDEFGSARFTGLNFSAAKPDLGTKLVRMYEDGRQILPRGSQYDEIVYDLAGIRVTASASGRMQFYETPNPIEKRSHCDIAWSNALSIAADDYEIPGDPVVFENARTRVARDRRNREVLA
jgi:phage FluMu gp28-like protein